MSISKNYLKSLFHHFVPYTIIKIIWQLISKSGTPVLFHMDVLDSY